MLRCMCVCDNEQSAICRILLCYQTLHLSVGSILSRVGQKPWIGRLEDAIGVKWISDRVFNHDPGIKKKQPSTILSYTNPWPLRYIAVLLYMQAQLYFIG